MLFVKYVLINLLEKLNNVSYVMLSVETRIFLICQEKVIYMQFFRSICCIEKINFFFFLGTGFASGGGKVVAEKFDVAFQ
jgi:hypothetical protein